jgi:PAS domain S-box-containing protein
MKDKTILIVDNNPVILKLIRNLLEKNDYQVQTAIDGLTALKILETYTPDIIFLDLVMPNICGRKLCRIIRSLPEIESAILIIISAIAAEEKIDLDEIGADACIAKGPFQKTAQHILDIVEKIEKNHLKRIKNKFIGMDELNPREITKELLTSRRHLEVVLNNISEGFLELAQNGKIIFANPAATRLFDIPEEKLLSSAFTSLFSARQARRIEKMLRLSVHVPVKVGSDSPIVRNDRQFSLKLLPVKDDDKHSTIIILEDISEQKRMEKKLQRAHQMEAIGTLAGGVAHDLNNILSGLVSYPELLLLDIPPHSALKQPLLTIKKSGEKASTIVQDMLTLTRRGVSITKVVNLNNIVSEYLKSPEHEKIRFFHPAVEIETDLEPRLFNMLGSPFHLMKTLMNLVSNAAEAIEFQGKISITTKNQYIDLPILGYEQIREGDYVTLTVSDNGKGIPPEDIERIFEPFFTKKSMGMSGTGLGMAVVWGTVKDHRGYVDVRSKPEKGSTFSLYFPTTLQKADVIKEKLPTESYLGKGESILIIDDVSEQREIAYNILTKLGYKAAAVASGEEAIEYLNDHTVDLLLLDMVMNPGIDGLEAFKKIIEIHPRQRAVIASGFAETERVKTTQKLGAGPFIKKPYTLETIGVAIRKELERNPSK